MKKKKKIRFNDENNMPSFFDEESGKLELIKPAVCGDGGVRRLGDMSDLLRDPTNADPELILYYTYRSVHREEDQDVLEKNACVCSYTIIPNNVINGERMKTYGHIHSVHPENHSVRPEVFEVVHGKGVFQLFKETDNQEVEVVLIFVEKGDHFVAPYEYCHTAITLSSEPFIFMDLNKLTGGDNDYGSLKRSQGAPLYAMKDKDNDSNYFMQNENWDDKKLKLKICTTTSLPWSNPLDADPIYVQFLRDPEAMALKAETNPTAAGLSGELARA